MRDVVKKKETFWILVWMVLEIAHECGPRPKKKDRGTPTSGETLVESGFNGVPNMQSRRFFHDASLQRLMQNAGGVKVELTKDSEGRGSVVLSGEGIKNGAVF